MADGSQSAATSGSSTGKTPAVKDKECPFCRQAFTSSSLGRHLDLYIKDKSPKLPDGLHDVEEIRKLRGNITRRQARQYSRREESTFSAAKATPSSDMRSPSMAPDDAKGQHVDGETLRTFFNKVNWQATGVINDLPPTSKRDPSIWATTPEHTQRSQVNHENSREQGYMEMDINIQRQAAELALKEVLESVKAATLLAHPPSPFDFNFFGLSLPQMYLQCLVPPPTLLREPTPRAHELSWSISPPSTMYCELLRGWLSNKLCDWRRRREHPQFGDVYLHNGLNCRADSQSEADAIRETEASYYAHLENAQQSWAQLTDEERLETWQHECAKAFAQEQEKHQATRRRLNEAEQEIQQLRVRLSQIASEQQLPEAVHRSPATLTLSREAVLHLPPHPQWDYNNLVSKWKTRLQSARCSQHPPQLAWSQGNHPREPLRANGNGRAPGSQLGNRSFSRAGGPDAQGDEDEELADAAGDDDPDEIECTEEHGGMSRGPLNPQFRDIGGLGRKRPRSMDAG
ncbi:MAG: hypothetical protein Q9163_000799 [Psora crenata]